MSAWTSRQFSAAMRHAGYKNHGQGCYIHKRTGRKFYAWSWTDETGGEAWREWAEARQTPPPF